jgi:hypothetical protein
MKTVGVLAERAALPKHKEEGRWERGEKEKRREKIRQGLLPLTIKN